MRIRLARIRASAARHRADLVWMLTVAVVAIAFHFGDVVLAVSHRLTGRSPDLVSGSAGFAWEAANSPWFASTSGWRGVPFGQPLWTWAHLSQAVQAVPQVLAAHVVGAFAATNLLVLAGFFGSFCATFAVARYLGMQRSIALLIGYLYAFSAFAMTRAGMHTSYVQQWVYPLVLWGAIAMIRRPDARSAGRLGVMLGFVAYVDGYFLPFGFISAGLVVLAWAIVGGAVGTVGRSHLVPVIRSCIAAFAIGAVLVAPVVVANALGAAGSEVQGRSASDLTSLASRPGDLVNPPEGHWLFERTVVAEPKMQWAETERIQYVGWIRLGLFAAALVLATRTILRTRSTAGSEGRPSADTSAAESHLAFDAGATAPPNVGRAQTVLSFGVLAVALFVVSGSPSFQFGALTVPNVSGALFAIAPVFRAWTRLSSAANLAGLLAIGSAATAVQPWLRSVSRGWATVGRAVVALLVAVMIVDNQSIGIEGGGRFDTRFAPAAYRQLAAMPDVRGIVELPRLWNTSYQEWATVHGKRTLNWMGTADGPNSMVDQALFQPTPYHLSVLKALGADVIAFHGDATDYIESTGLEKIGTFGLDDAVTTDPGVLDRRVGFPDAPLHDITLLRLPSTTAAAAAWCDRGFGTMELNDSHLDCLQAERRSTLGAALLPWPSDRRTPGGSVRLTFQLGALTDRSVAVQQGSRTLWSGTVGQEPVDIEVVVSESLPVEIATSDPLTLTNLGTRVGATVRDLVAEPAS